MRNFVLVSMCCLCLSMSTVFSAVWTVDSQGRADFTAIQEAVSDSVVQSGDMILVRPGEYEELIRVPSSKQLTIRSLEGFENTIIRRPREPFNGPQMTVLIQSQSVFEGFTVEDPYGTALMSTKLQEIPERGKILENTAAITITGPAIVQYNRVIQHRFGLLQECPSGALGLVPFVRYNITENNDIGICCCETFSEVRDNIVRSNYWVGIISAHSSCDEIANNLIIGNGTAGRDFSCGILCWQSYDWKQYELNPRISINTIASNIGDGIVCIYEMGAPNIPVIEHSIIALNSGIGVRVVPTEDIKDMPRPRVSRCNIWGNGVANAVNIHRLVDCMSADPLFTDDFRLNNESPCIDYGSFPDNKGSSTLAGRQDRGRVDLGYHYPLVVVSP